VPGFFISMDGWYVENAGSIVSTISMDGWYVENAGA
jgi:hypothetical protein